jgi:hypothetical protein
LFAAAERVKTEVQIEILVSVAAHDVAAIEYLTQLRVSASTLRFFTVPKPLSSSAARNFLLPFADAAWLFFIDDDAYVEADFFECFSKSRREFPAALVIGGPNLTPAESSRFQRASGAALSSRFGASRSSARYAPRRNEAQLCGEEYLILCNLFISRQVTPNLKFPETLICNEENWLLQDLERLGHQFVYDPHLCVLHERRRSLKEFATQIHRYGIGRGQVLRFRPTTARVFHLLPPLSLIFSLLAIATWPWMTAFAFVWAGLLAVYAAFWIVATIRMRTRTLESAIVCLNGAALFPLIHLAYGFGVLRGLVER